MFFWYSLAFSMIHRMLAIWSLVPLPFLKPGWPPGSSRSTYCWSLAWRSLIITSLVCEMSAIVRWFEHSLALPFFGTGMKTDLLQSCGHCWVFQICWHIECSTFTASSFRIWNSLLHTDFSFDFTSVFSPYFISSLISLFSAYYHVIPFVSCFKIYLSELVIHIKTLWAWGALLTRVHLEHLEKLAWIHLSPKANVFESKISSLRFWIILTYSTNLHFIECVTCSLWVWGCHASTQNIKCSSLVPKKTEMIFKRRIVTSCG